MHQKNFFERLLIFEKIFIKKKEKSFIVLTYQNYIRNCIKNKYSESTIVNQKFFILFKESRINFLKNCFKN